MHPYGTDIVQFARADLEQRLGDLPRVPLVDYPTRVEEMPRLREALGGGPRLLIKRDDAIPFACGGNKVRKLELVAAAALADGADTLVTSGGLQSNHARVTAAVAARLGLRCMLVLNGTPPEYPTGNTRLMTHFGAELEFVAHRSARTPRMHDISAHLSSQGRRPYLIPLGASTPLGALAFVRAVQELLTQVDPPDVIVAATSSGGTQAGLAAGCALFATGTRVIGISADDPADEIARVSSTLAGEALALIGSDGMPTGSLPIEVDDTFVGGGYGQVTAASAEAAGLAARTEGLIIDPVYTAKALAYLIAAVRQGHFTADQTVLFWHTGGIPGFFA